MNDQPSTPQEIAKDAGLRYIDDTRPGIRRERDGETFVYYAPGGDPIHDDATLARIRKLAIPPAYTDVWIAPQANGHIQATGRDAKGRKQYRYHQRWTAARGETKYTRMLAFGAALPQLRAQIARDMALPGLPREKVLATVVRLLETTLIRVGNEEYARSNKSYGLTTMRDKHVAVDGSTLRFSFTGKSGVKHNVSINDRKLARVVKGCREIPGHELFQYLDDDGQRHSVDSDDVNAYLRTVTSEPFTAKDFRTWAGTVIATIALHEIGVFDEETQARKNVVAAVERVAQRLGNTRAVSQKSYIHPEVINAYLAGTLLDALVQRTADELEHAAQGLDPEETMVLAFLKRRLAREVAQDAADQTAQDTPRRRRPARTPAPAADRA